MENKTENLTPYPQSNPQDPQAEEPSEGIIDRLLRFFKSRSESEDEDEYDI